MDKLQQEAEQLRDYLERCKDHHDDPTSIIRIFLESAFMDGKIEGLCVIEKERKEKLYV